MLRRRLRRHDREDLVLERPRGLIVECVAQLTQERCIDEIVDYDMREWIRRSKTSRELVHAPPRRVDDHGRQHRECAARLVYPSNFQPASAASQSRTAAVS